ncbi:hypothetical protein ACIBEJ_24935 [Nonomuraea sp. NPDC050790]|uniref:hypothetical protein n=1 Tax=Nonomuraea sp. NPDC050790 TaxID=3364371 RepID=UPI0037A290A8
MQWAERLGALMLSNVFAAGGEHGIPAFLIKRGFVMPISSRIARSAGLAGLAVALVAGCGGTAAAPGGEGAVDKAALVAKMKEVVGDGIPAQTMECMADAMLKHGDQATLKAVIAGEVSVSEDFKAFGAKEKQIQKAVSDCK